MPFKYLVDAALLWLATGRVWTPLDYLSPLDTRAGFVSEADAGRASSFSDSSKVLRNR